MENTNDVESKTVTCACGKVLKRELVVLRSHSFLCRRAMKDAGFYQALISLTDVEAGR